MMGYSQKSPIQSLLVRRFFINIPLKVMLFIFFICFLYVPFSHAEEKPHVAILPLNGPINPGTAGFIVNGIKRAQEDGARCIIIQMDTPGGLDSSMRMIIKNILASSVPVVVFVGPGGARAASAGVMITLSADIAAMAPGTNIGAAHPVTIGGKDIGKEMGKKIENDMVAYVRSLAQKRGRNVEWAEKAVRESVSIPAEEALKHNVIDLIAKDIPDLISKIDGKKINGKVLKIKELPRIVYKESFKDRVLKTISDPNIAYILMMIGLMGLYFELAHPGAVFPGVVGAICLILAFYAFQALPVNYAGILLIILAIIFFLAEIKIPSGGLLSVGGIISLLIGSLMLFKTPQSFVRVSLKVLIPVVMTVSVFFIVIVFLVIKVRLRRPATGMEGMIGLHGIAETSFDSSSTGKIFVRGEIWDAISDETINKGEKVEVIDMNNMVLTVKKITHRR